MTFLTKHVEYLMDGRELEKVNKSSWQTPYGSR